MNGEKECCKLARMDERLKAANLAVEVARVAGRSWMASLIAIVLAAAALITAFAKLVR